MSDKAFVGVRPAGWLAEDPADQAVQLLDFAELADRLGFDVLYVGDRLLATAGTDDLAVYDAPMLEPFVLLSGDGGAHDAHPAGPARRGRAVPPPGVAGQDHRQPGRRLQRALRLRRRLGLEPGRAADVRRGLAQARAPDGGGHRDDPAPVARRDGDRGGRVLAARRRPRPAAAGPGPGSAGVAGVLRPRRRRRVVGRVQRRPAPRARAHRAHRRRLGPADLLRRPQAPAERAAVRRRAGTSSPPRPRRPVATRARSTASTPTGSRSSTTRRTAGPARRASRASSRAPTRTAARRT